MKIKSVAVLGAGAVGSYVIWGLSEKKDIRLGVIASGERAKAASAPTSLPMNMPPTPPEWMT